MNGPWETKWKLEDELGLGGQGLVYKVSSRENPNTVGTIKILKNYKKEQPRARMVQEVTNLRTLKTANGCVPGVIDDNMIDFPNPEIRLYVVMDHIDGPNLAEYIKKNGPISIDAALRCALSLCETIVYAHKLGVLHRDLKPENIIIRDLDSADLAIVDYGLSFNVEDSGDLTKVSEHFRTNFLELPETNTPGGDHRDARSDVTLLCGVLYYCITGHRPGQLTDGTGALPHMRNSTGIQKMIRGDLRRIALESFFTKGFHPDLSNRFQTAVEAQNRLFSIVNHEDPTKGGDPIALSAVLSEQIRVLDRKTQLAEFARTVKVIDTILNEKLGQCHQKLGRFIIGLFPSGKIGRLPEDIDLVGASTNNPLITMKHHEDQRVRFYTVGSRGERCVILATNKNTRGNRSPEVQPDDWHEVAWYEGDPTQIKALLLEDFDVWLRWAMTDLFNTLEHLNSRSSASGRDRV